MSEREVFMQDDARCISTIRAIVECVMMKLGANNHDFRLRDKLIVTAAPYLEKHEVALTASRERERVLRQALNALVTAADNYQCQISAGEEAAIGVEIQSSRLDYAMVEAQAALAKTGGG